jgi:small-conductance mechanosensitive channel
MSHTFRARGSLPFAAFACIAVFPLVVAVLHLVQAGRYHPLSEAVSELALGRAGWLMAIAFCSLGTGTLLLASTLRRVATHPRVAPMLIAISGLLSFVSAFVHADGPNAATTTHGQIHQFVGVATFVLMIAGMFALVRSLRRDPAWRAIATPTLGWAVAAVAGFLLIPLSGSTYFGLAQRIFLAIILSWALTISLYAHRTEAYDRDGSPATSDADKSLGPERGIATT